MNQALKKQVKERAGNKCEKCGSVSYLSVDHIVPKSVGGTDALSNLQCLCMLCNAEKANRVTRTFWERIKYIWNIGNEVSNFNSKVQSLDAGVSNLRSRQDKHFIEVDKRLDRMQDQINRLHVQVKERDEAVDWLYSGLLEIRDKKYAKEKEIQD